MGASGGSELSGVVVEGNVDFVEKGLVEQAADVVGCPSVGVGGVLGLGDEFLLGVQILVQGSLPSLDGGQLVGDASLFDFEGLQGGGRRRSGLGGVFRVGVPVGGGCPSSGEQPPCHRSR